MSNSPIRMFIFLIVVHCEVCSCVCGGRGIARGKREGENDIILKKVKLGCRTNHTVLYMVIVWHVIHECMHLESQREAWTV